MRLGCEVLWQHSANTQNSLSVSTMLAFVNETIAQPGNQANKYVESLHETRPTGLRTF